MIPLVELSSNQMYPIHGQFALYNYATHENILCSIGNLESENMYLPQLSLVYYLEAYKIFFVPLRS